MSYLQKLQGTISIHDFAPLLGFEPKKLAYLLFKEVPEKKYNQFTIPKKSGGVRTINAPQKGLKLAQKRLANILNSCMQKIESNRNLPRRPLAHGFKKKVKTESGKHLALGIHTNAKCHNNQRYVLNLDLADFFPSFNFGRVRGFFISNNDFKLSPAVATLIAQVACHENQLPQGSPCSPIITNLIAHILDVRLTQWAKKYGCTYSRYADDITFSTNKKDLPEQLATPSEQPNQWCVGQEIEAIIKKSGFSINPTKTRLQFRPSRQMVTGLVVNKKVNIRSEYYRHTRSMCYALFSQGVFFIPGGNNPASIQQLEGILSHIHFIKEYSRTPAEIERRKESLENAKGTKRPKLDAVTELYSRFLYFRYFVALERPLILCEGKTDVVYLKAAIKQLKKAGFQFPHETDFFSFTRRIREVMRIHDGATSFKNFIEHYEKSTDFKFQARQHPVIVLLDNDKAADNVMKMLSGKFKKSGITYDRNRTFIYHAISNLYIALLPKTQPDNPDNKIEDFFDQSVTVTVLDGKTFSAENAKIFDNQKHYSKQVLATKVVRPNQASINFNGFKPILELLSNVITRHVPQLPLL